MSTKSVVLIGVLSLFAIMFYWFQLRPANIKSSCMQRFYDLCETSSLGYDKCVRTFQTQWSEPLERAYRGCLHEKGL